MKNVVILGAGFAGLRTALNLESKLTRLHEEWSIILIDKNSYHTYTATLYEVASAYSWRHARDFENLLGSSSCLSIKSIIGNKNITFVKQKISDIDFENKLIMTGDGDTISFEYLVMAFGSETTHFGIAGAEQCCFALKTLKDALSIRRRIEDIFKNNNGGDIRIVMVGAGATGVETISEIAKCARHLAREYKIDYSRVNISLLEARDNILSQTVLAQRNAVERRLEKLGIKIITGSKINEVLSTCVVLGSGEKCEADITIWGGGTKGPALFANFETTELDKRGRIKVNKFLQARGLKQIFAIGDNTSFEGAPATAFIAVAEADIASKNILALILGQPLKEYIPRIPGYVISCGGKYAVVNIFGRTFSGFFGWVIKRLIDLKYFMSIMPLYKALLLWFKELNLFTKND